MNRLKVSLIILSIAILLCVGDLLFLNFTIDNFKDQVQAVKQDLYNQEREKAEEKLDMLLYNYRNKEYLISIFINHEPIDELEESLVAMKVYLEQENNEDFFLESEKTICKLGHMMEAEIPHLGNIF